MSSATMQNAHWPRSNLTRPGRYIDERTTTRHGLVDTGRLKRTQSSAGPVTANNSHPKNHAKTQLNKTQTVSPNYPNSNTNSSKTVQNDTIQNCTEQNSKTQQMINDDHTESIANKASKNVISSNIVASLNRPLGLSSRPAKKQQRPMTACASSLGKTSSTSNIGTVSKKAWLHGMEQANKESRTPVITSTVSDRNTTNQNSLKFLLGNDNKFSQFTGVISDPNHNFGSSSSSRNVIGGAHAVRQRPKSASSVTLEKALSNLNLNDYGINTGPNSKFNFKNGSSEVNLSEALRLARIQIEKEKERVARSDSRGNKGGPPPVSHSASSSANDFTRVEIEGPPNLSQTDADNCVTAKIASRQRPVSAALFTKFNRPLPGRVAATVNHTAVAGQGSGSGLNGQAGSLGKRVRPQSAKPFSNSAVDRAAQYADQLAAVNAIGSNGLPNQRQVSAPKTRHMSKSLLQNFTQTGQTQKTIESRSKGGHYVIGRMIGQGAYAVVKSCLHQPSNQTFAIKIFDKTRNDWESRKKLVYREVKLMEKFCRENSENSNICHFLEYVDTSSCLHLIMEEVNGGNLRQELNRKMNRRLAEDVVRDYFGQICQGVDYIHRNLVIHRDLKLENLLLQKGERTQLDHPSSVTANGSTSSSYHRPVKVKIVDFGFALKLQSASQKLKVFCGTPSYMSPEIVAGREYSGFQSDIWALGVVLYVLLQGRFPFKAQQEHELYSKIRRGSFLLDNTVSSFAKRVIKGILRVDCNLRPNVSQILSHDWIRQSGPPMSATEKALNESKSGTNLSLNSHSNTYNHTTTAAVTPQDGITQNHSLGRIFSQSRPQSAFSHMDHTSSNALINSTHNQNLMNTLNSNAGTGAGLTSSNTSNPSLRMRQEITSISDGDLDRDLGPMKDEEKVLLINNYSSDNLSIEEVGNSLETAPRQALRSNSGVL